MRLATTLAVFILPFSACWPGSVLPVEASQVGDACRKEICEAVVSACMSADFSDNPLAFTADEKKAYCAGFYQGCISRSVDADTPWYSPETVERFLKCPP